MHPDIVSVIKCEKNNNNMFTMLIIYIIVRGHLINLIFISVFIILAIVQRFLLTRANNAKIEEKSKLTAEELQLLEENEDRIGDESLDYEYRL
jgi:hypothetical protein